MSVQLDPSSQLAFQKPFNVLVKQLLRVSNPNSQPVAFKVKTTAPKQYCVRPNSGRIEPGDSVEVQVLLQPMKEDPPLSHKSKDKFLVQSTFITPSKENLSLNDLWATVSDGVHQQKLKVAFLPAEGTLQEEDEGDLVGHQSSMFTEGDSKFDTARQYETVRQSNGHHDNAATGIPVFDPLPVNAPPASRTPPQSFQPERSVPAPVPVVVNSDQQDSGLTATYAAKLAEARAEISRLQELLASATEVRRRKPFSEDGSVAPNGIDDDGASVVENVAPEGVPLNIVAVLSILVFLVTYLFF